MNFYPPYNTLTYVLDYCSKAGSLYMLLWKLKEENKSHRIRFNKTDVANEYGLHWKKLKHDLRLLKKQRLLEFTSNIEDNEVTIVLQNSPYENEKAA